MLKTDLFSCFVSYFTSVLFLWLKKSTRLCGNSIYLVIFFFFFFLWDRSLKKFGQDMEPSVIIKARYGALSNHFHICFVRRPNLRFQICVKTLSSNRRNMVLSLLRSYVSFILFKARITNNFLADTMECVHEIKICLCHKYLL